MTLRTMLYRTIYADPPWPERGGGVITRGAQRHYPLLPVREIESLRVNGRPVREISNPAGAHCYLWVTNNYLPDGLRILGAWGFVYKTVITWAKDRQGLGQYFRGQTEQLLFGVRGSQPYRVDADGKRCQGSTLITAPRGVHSRKPDSVREIIERVSYPPFIELFAREAVAGWVAWGEDSASGSDQRGLFAQAASE